MTGFQLLREHVERFNAGVRSGDFGPMLEHFTEDATLEFRGVPVGPFHGREAIAAAYRVQPPDDEIWVRDVGEHENEVRARYRWLRDHNDWSGEMTLVRNGDRIARLVVTFDPGTLP